MRSRPLQLGLSLLLAGCLAPEPAPHGGTGSPDVGAKLYAKYCGFCHGDAGEGYVSPAANALANQAFLAAVDDSFLDQAIALGRPGTKMSAWGVKVGGPLDDDDVADLIAFIRTWQTEPTADLGAPPTGGDKTAGAALYANQCASCHGGEGEGTSLALSLNNPVFLDSASDAFLAYAIRLGRPGTTMQAYGETLTEAEIADLVAWIRSLQTPIDPNPPVKPPKTDMVLNPDGPEPDFTVGDEFISCDDVKAALDAGSKMILLDARPQSDYAFEHITGAANIPFFEIETRYTEVPEDVWVIAYCGCPHDESGILARGLRAQGHKKVAVLDEGYFVWKEKGYGVTVDGVEQ